MPGHESSLETGKLVAARPLLNAAQAWRSRATPHTYDVIGSVRANLAAQPVMECLVPKAGVEGIAGCGSDGCTKDVQRMYAVRLNEG